ncbi:hypothetical protein O181_011526 [Austropuccinia psidii MF-1]|uniref:MICOS complex subunit MIC10 n=1 Tax=Austropuccinia psidii MF-1 TaxID=1389203 RepID=A0A9Q3BSY6_9BASI|nr:hypothetical protein [Austropuccinia psidii MF-1]
MSGRKKARIVSWIDSNSPPTQQLSSAIVYKERRLHRHPDWSFSSSVFRNNLMASQRVRSSEDILSEKTDVCIANAIVKTGIGFGGGVILSVIAFRRRAFPVWIGLGCGLGASYSDCQRTFNPAHLPGYKLLDSYNPSQPQADSQSSLSHSQSERML